MFPLSANRLSLWVLTVAVVMLGACSSAPPRNDSEASQKAEASSQASGEVAPEGAPQASPPIPQEAVVRFENALTAMNAGDHTRAEVELKQLSEAYPAYSGALANLGILYLKLGKLTEAETALKSAVERSPNNAAAFNQLGIAYRRMGKFKDADAAYSKAIEIDPNYALAHLNLGVLCDLYLQQPERALAAYERYSALASDPDSRVAGWIKELQSRVKTQRPAEGVAQ